MYSEKVMDHFTNPRNVGEIENADGVGLAGNPVCGDVMKISIKVKKEKDKTFIEDVKFKTMGCAAAIATSSMVTELAKGKTIDYAMKITKKDVSGALDGLPPIKMHCSNLAADALDEAIYDYFSRNGIEIPGELELKHRKIKKDADNIHEEHNGIPEDKCE